MDDIDPKVSRMVEDLNAEEVAVLRTVTQENLTVEVLSLWEDDHEQCVGVKLNGIVVSFWWLTFEAAAAFAYPDSPKAREMILQVLKDGLDDVGIS